VDDQWRLSQILAEQARGAHVAGDMLGIRAAAEEGRGLADAIGDGSNSRLCRFYLAVVQQFSGELGGAAVQLGEVAAEAEAAHDEISRVTSLGGQSFAFAHQGETAAARAAADAILEGGAGLGGRWAAYAHMVSGFAALAAGDFAAAHEAREATLRSPIVVSGGAAALRRIWNAEAALADQDLTAARRWADEAVSTGTGWWLMAALGTHARVAIAQGEPEQAERDAHDALTRATELGAHLGVAGVLECLAVLAVDGASHREAARLLGAARAIRQCTGEVRFKAWDAGYEALVAELRNAMGDSDFDSAWAEGAALSTEEAIAYARRGRGRRKRPTSGWGALTPTELDVVRLVSEGLTNSHIAVRLFVSPRTVQTHLTHVYTKLGLTSRVQLAQQATRRG
jgi:DNA-binding CsgD family transcriptional regulator